MVKALPTHVYAEGAGLARDGGLYAAIFSSPPGIFHDFTPKSPDFERYKLKIIPDGLPVLG